MRGFRAKETQPTVSNATSRIKLGSSLSGTLLAGLFDPEGLVSFFTIRPRTRTQRRVSPVWCSAPTEHCRIGLRPAVVAVVPERRYAASIPHRKVCWQDKWAFAGFSFRNRGAGPAKTGKGVLTDTPPPQFLVEILRLKSIVVKPHAPLVREITSTSAKASAKHP